MRDALNMGLGERTVEVERLKLVEKLKENLESHKQNYSLAVEGYQVAATKRLQELQEKAQAAFSKNFDEIQSLIDGFTPGTPPKLGGQVTVMDAFTFRLKVPEDHSKSYEVAIAMAENDVNDTVTLTQSQFQCFWLDDWDWRDDFEETTSLYNHLGPRGPKGPRG